MKRTDDMLSPSLTDGFCVFSDMTRRLVNDTREATRDAKDAEDSHRFVFPCAVASYQAIERDMFVCASDAECTITNIMDVVGVITDRLRGSGERVVAARSAVESGIAAVNGHVAPTTGSQTNGVRMRKRWSHSCTPRHRWSWLYATRVPLQRKPRVS